MAVATVPLQLAFQPNLGVGAGEAALVVERDLGLGQRVGHEVEVAGLQLEEERGAAGPRAASLRAIEWQALRR